MNKTGWIIFSVVVAAVLAGLVIWTRIANPPVDVSGIDNGALVSASINNGNIADHVTGKKDSKVILIEYGDFQCPGCGDIYPHTKTLLKDYGDKIGFVFRNFPLTSIHPNARVAAASAEAAGLQGKYWEMHDLIYDNQGDWSNATGEKRGNIFSGYAESLGLDMDKFNKDLQGKTVESSDSSVIKKIAFDQALGKAAGVDSTPTFFINGNLVDETTRESFAKGDLTAIKAALDEALKNSQ